MHLCRGKIRFAKHDTYDSEQLVKIAVIPWLKKYYEEVYIKGKKDSISHQYIMEQYPGLTMGSPEYDQAISNCIDKLKSDLEFVIKWLDMGEPEAPELSFRTSTSKTNSGLITRTFRPFDPFSWDNYLAKSREYHKNYRKASELLGKILIYLSW